MILPALPLDEDRRYGAVLDLGLLDTEPEERFDRIVRLAARLLDVPIALISIVADDRVWYKARLGWHRTHTDRDDSFCAHTILEPNDDVFHVADATSDERFRDNPHVTDSPHLRFYAGHPLRSLDGHRVGALCVVDDRARDLSEADRQVIRDLAAIAESELARTDVRIALAQLDESERRKALILDTIHDGLVMQTARGRFLEWNAAAERLLGLTPRQLTGSEPVDPLWGAVHADGTAWAFDEFPASVAVRTGLPVVGIEMGINRTDGTQRWLRVNSAPVINPDGTLRGAVSSFIDVTDERANSMLLDAIYDQAPVGITVVDESNRIIRTNEQYASQVGQSLETLRGAEFTPGLIAVGDQMMTAPDGTERWLQLTGSRVESSGHTFHVVATADVTSRRRLESELIRFSFLFAHATDLITIVDKDGMLLYVSPSVERVLGYPADPTLAGDIFGMIHPDDQEIARFELFRLAAGETQQRPLTIRVHDSRAQWRHFEVLAVNLLDEPEVGGIVITARDVSDRQLLTSRLEHQATHDPLTDLPNRTLCQREIATSLARCERSGDRVAVCYIDLDGFKRINDEVGHDSGDELLIDVANRLRAALRGGDSVWRIGGDEFIVLIDPVADDHDALVAGRRIIAAIEGPRVLSDGRRVTCGASAGVVLSEPNESAAQIVVRADGALRLAKAAGKNRAVFAGA